LPSTETSFPGIRNSIRTGSSADTSIDSNFHQRYRPTSQPGSRDIAWREAWQKREGAFVAEKMVENEKILEIENGFFDRRELIRRLENDDLTIPKGKRDE
jgi:hypothetical protein